MFKKKQRRCGKSFPARQTAEVSQSPGETVEPVELRKKFFERYTDRDEWQAAPDELKTLLLVQFGLLEDGSCCAEVTVL